MLVQMKPLQMQCKFFLSIHRKQSEIFDVWRKLCQNSRKVLLWKRSFCYPCVRIYYILCNYTGEKYSRTHSKRKLIFKIYEKEIIMNFRGNFFHIQLMWKIKDTIYWTNTITWFTHTWTLYFQHNEKLWLKFNKIK